MSWSWVEKQKRKAELLLVKDAWNMHLLCQGNDYEHGPHFMEPYVVYLNKQWVMDTVPYLKIANTIATIAVKCGAPNVANMLPDAG